MPSKQHRDNRKQFRKERLISKEQKIQRRIKRRKMKRLKQSERRNSLALAQKLLTMAKNTSFRRKQRYFRMNEKHLSPIIDLVSSDNNNKPRENYDVSNKHTKYKDNNEEDNDDDDCILVEPQIECITIDDEVSSGTATYTNSTPIAKAKENRLVTQTQTQPKEGNYPDNIYVEDTRGGFQIKNPMYYYSLNWRSLIEENVRVSWQRRSNSPETIACNGSNEIISLDDTALAVDDINNAPSNSLAINNSVEFVQEMQLDDFIPLNSTKPLKPLKDANDNNAELPNRKRNKQCNTLFTASELKQLHMYNSNTYNPNANEPPLSAKRMIIIDGSNVAFSHHLNRSFSVKGIKIAIEYFEKLGHEVKAVIPQYRLQHCKSTDPKELHRLRNDGKIVLTPCKKLYGKSATSYDDRFILQLACELDAVILSNDNYQDLVHENSAFRKIIENRVIGYTWCNDIFLLPKDPYGKWGPSLSDILNRY